MEHNHTPQFGPPYEWNKPVTCEACKAELKDALIANFKKSCEKYGTDFDLRLIADLLLPYGMEVDHADV
jgi:hypothetical protein